MRYRFIHAEKANYPLWLLCSTMRVSTKGYYSWLHRGERQTRGYSEVDREISKIHTENARCYGTRRQKAALAKRGHHLARKTISERMRRLGLKVKYPRAYRVTTQADEAAKFAPNLLARKFHQTAPNQVWVGDICYVKTSSGFLYLATVIDLFSRMVVGWSVKSTMTADLVTDALKMALSRRQTAPGLIFHSDRGSQYTSETFRQACEKASILQSMSRKGDCWDNAIAESFFSTIRKEKLEDERGWSPARAKLEIFTYIETDFNRRRLHSALGYQSPSEFEKKALLQATEQAQAA